ncbi:histidine kinase [Mucilaginibacter sp. dw_454]|uniref:sensor histidine kinase n=1 Tax=Mucilaginibacter sp. dw_454 TaxID=2720079 RepID=UPI001BD5F254|nr:histidine kinase [Mucilaginibacter sp. dw_454]
MQKTTDNIFVLVLIATAGTVLMVVSFILIYIRNQNKLLQQRQMLQQAELIHQKELLQVVIESQEEERKRIGRDLHDDVGAAISSLRLIIDMFKPSVVDDAHLKFIRSSKDIIDKMMNDVRHISHNLSPTALTYYGLAFAIEEQCTIINQTGKLMIDFVNDAKDVLENLSLPVSTALYRVLEELLNNTIKHARAGKAGLKFKADDNLLVIDYSDNGVGAETKLVSNGIGMHNIESRLTVINASYHITTSPGNGFRIQINYPLT